jgi:hypothetical protein
MLVALAFQNVTLAGEDYRTVLMVALALIVLADCCFIAAFVRSGPVGRCASVVLMLPTLIVVADVLRRTPHSFS